MSHPHPEFGVDLTGGNYELHASANDTPDQLNGNHCCYIKFTDSIAAQLLDFASSRRCYEGMQIGEIQFNTSSSGVVSLEPISGNLSHCSLIVTKEANPSYNEVYETEYDRPPSNAMFFRRKGFIHTKLAVKPLVASSDHSIKSRIRNPCPKRAVTKFNEVRGAQQLNMRQINAKRRLENMKAAPPSKRLKVPQLQRNVTLTEAIGEILYVGQQPYEYIKKVISARTSLSCQEPEFSKALDVMATFYEQTSEYYLKQEFHSGHVNWENSCVLLESEKQKIRDRMKPNGAEGADGEQSERGQSEECKAEREPTRVSDPAAQEFEEKYETVSDEIRYNEYNNVYNDKFNSVQKWLASIKENKEYFHRMKKMIHDEQDQERQKQMKAEFRSIFNQRASGIKQMEKAVERTKLELTVIKNRINDYVQLQQLLIQSAK
mmetsp:Transcript_1479/g.2352  ORF Transcript_1479/g.2352 Transcript_1479/m.2352 type:complete len:433 (+) Transcript_1479:1147-2445(+)|eukprot:CAMPEP_0197032678 /NCGR_PEP_ID=MMETSP1384-20130603/11289_1 /TAXON_ID=29189 /ORGANISM="Ammonia sp." /LENGTH=432 /DNA_ID=CAMNT_0042462373 /DNA_START=1141 /DNA_END=2439 /DNA_ORIENTATION=-